MNKTKIEWCDYTWNPITGCLQGCPYCYARRMARRFGHSFMPQFHPDRLKQPQQLKKPSVIFVCSVSDLWGKQVHPSWRRQVFEIMDSTPRHTYCALTKRPGAIKEAVPDNCMVGVSIETETAMGRYVVLLLSQYHFTKHRFISFEPLLGRIPIKRLQGIEWVIIGGLSDKRKPRPDHTWVTHLVNVGQEHNIPIFLKDNLQCPGVIKEYPRLIMRMGTRS